MCLCLCVCVHGCINVSQAVPGIIGDDFLNISMTLTKSRVITMEDSIYTFYYTFKGRNALFD